MFVIVDFCTKKKFLRLTQKWSELLGLNPWTSDLFKQLAPTRIQNQAERRPML